jgi:eukaryotic-like serine/threonine-protein kinase
MTLLDGRFALETEHRRGGMGAVWKASDRQSQRLVAVKILHSHSARDQAQRFAREATLLAELEHENIVGYVAHGATPEGVPYLVMEWLEGENLAERLARQPLSLAESLTLLRAVVRALGVAHQRGVIHRDLKPSNLFLRQGSVSDVVLLDLGIARVLASEDALTRTGTILGTPSYMAPEQAQGLGDIGPAADVFSLGCVLYECIAGEPPFVGNHVLSVLAKLLFQDAPRLRERRADVPLDVEQLVERMLSKDRAQRPANAAELATALAHLNDVEPTLALASPSSVRPGSGEQELVSVILATRGSASAASEPPSLELSAFGGELKLLADGTSVVTLAHRRGAATDLAIRAARCALRLRDAAPDWHIVLATGRAVPLDRVHIGEAVDRAATLLRAREQSAAGPIWLDEMSAGLLDARFRVSAVADGIFALDGEEPTVDPARLLLGLPTACVGREHELATLELLLRASIEESSPRAVLVVAAAGMGKTRLRHELVRRLHASGGELLVLDGLGDPIRTSSRSGLLGSALARLCGLRAEYDAGENRARLEARIGECLRPAERARTAAFLAELCGVNYPPGLVPELDAAQRVPHQVARLIEQAWLGFLRAEAAVRPVLLVLDNLQWSDAVSVSLVGAALRELSSSPLLVLGLARPEVNELFPELWERHLARLPLRPLPAPAMTRLVRQVLGAGIGDDSVRRLVARADGNALYLEELIRAAASGRDAVPETVVAMLQARIALLAPALRRVLRAASVFGEGFAVAGVQALLLGMLPEAEVAQALLTLVEHEILERPAQPGQSRAYSFRHVLMRDAAYGLFTAEDRALSHVLAARFLLAAAEDPAVVAAHFELGGEPAEAVRHYVAAAELAYRRADHAAIQALVQRALAAGASQLERGMLRSIEAPTLLFRHDFEGCWAAAQESLALLPARHRRRSQSLGTSAFCGVHMGKAAEIGPFVEELHATEPEERDRAEYTMSVGYACFANIIVANRRMSTRLLATIARIDGQLAGEDLVARGSVLFCRAFFLQLLGDSPYEAWSLAQHSTAQQRAIGNRRLLANSLVMLGEAARWLFSVDEAARAMSEAVKLARDTGETAGLDYLSQYLVSLLAEHGSEAALGEARELASLPLRRRQSGGMYRGLGLAALAALELREGDLVGAEGHAREARALLRALGHRAFWPHVDRVLLHVLIKAGNAAAGALADEALATLASCGPLGHLELPLRLAAASAQLAVGRRQDAARVVTAALGALGTRAAKIPTAAMRERFITAVPENAALRQLGRELGVDQEHTPV